ncbi:MAG: YfiR family protein [Phenylobacterium sp.]
MSLLPLHFLSRVIGAAVAVLALAAAPVRAQDASGAEQATKAAMIYNFGRFTTWPDARFGGAGDPVVLCIDPAASLAGPLQGVNGKPVGARTLAVRQTSHIDSSCNMAYVAGRDVSDSYVAGLRDKGVLTIGEAPGFTRSGSIQLVTIGRQVRFQINQQNALASGARLSSNLLRLAVAVH